MRLVLVVLLAGVFAGCGVLDDEDPTVLGQPDPAVYGPSTADPSASTTLPEPRLLPPDDAVARKLDGGSIGVVDLIGTVGIEPSSLETASDLTLEDVRWTRWEASGASGTGRMRLLTCQPTCATGGTEELPASITLSGVKVCDGRRYFSGGAVVIVAKDTQPATYLRAPC